MNSILLVDDERWVRTALRKTIEKTGLPFQVVHEAVNGLDALDWLNRNQADLVMTDVRMPVMDGLAATEALRARRDAPEVIVLTTFDADEHILRALRAGAAGFLLKDTPPHEIVAAIHRVAQGQPVLSPEVTRRLIDRVAETGYDRRRAAARE